MNEKPVVKKKTDADDERRGKYYKRWKESQNAENTDPYCSRCKEKLDDESRVRKHLLCCLCRPGIIRAFPDLKNTLDKFMNL